MMSVRRKGFTLIELLVVIAIIAILAAILFPVFMAARESARTSKCVANMKNIAQALAQYRDDYDGRNCGIWQGGSADDYGSFWFVIENYVGQNLEREDKGLGNKSMRSIYKCPSARWLEQRWDQSSFGQRTNTGFAYTMNETGWNDTRYGSVIYAGQGLPDSRFRRPSQIIFVSEGMGWVSYGVAYGDGSIIDNEKPKGSNGSGDGWKSLHPPRDETIPLSEPGYLGLHHGSRTKIYNLRVSHSMGANCLFYDGHIKLLKTTKGYNWSVLY